MQVHGPLQKVEFNTCVTSSSRTTIDLLFSNDHLISCSRLPTEIVSDDETILIKKNVTDVRHQEELTTRSVISWKNYSKSSLQCLLHESIGVIITNLILKKN